MRKNCVTEPVLVNTVSNFTVSSEVLNRAEASLMKDSFLQEEKTRRAIKSVERIDFITTNVIIINALNGEMEEKLWGGITAKARRRKENS